MNRSLYTKLVLIILFLIIALMLVAGVFLTRGVRNFYLSDFYDNMAEVFQPRSWRTPCATRPRTTTPST